jgi:hypothetical protein
METCGKNGYPDQVSARLALAAIRDTKAKKLSNLPVRVYPCDRFDAWHLTSKKVSGKNPPWDRDPHWKRPT